ncbi:hypothetical protein [Streptosporangium sp. NPDC051022]|jgi:hypothetical protein|uniref:hypothetical protein n=1 Tax=Streptosporangium sp. NPDC051022 TaxID=3155752 RepID=UPI00343461B5
MQPDNLTVTARVARTAVPGRLDDLTEWAHGFTGRAQSFPGYRAWSPAGWWSFGPAAS